MSALKSIVAAGTKLWLDSIDPELVRSNREEGATGATSNPVIVSDLIRTGRFDDDLIKLLDGGASDDAAAWQLTDKLVRAAQAVFHPVWQQTKGNDGYVSFELDPLLEDPVANIPHAERVRRYIELGKKWAAGHKNRMIKVPATPAGLDALVLPITAPLPPNPAELDEAVAILSKAKRPMWIIRVGHAHIRLFTSAAIGLAIVAALPASLTLITRLLVGWDIGILIYLVAAAAMMARSSTAQIRVHADAQDEGAFGLLILSVIAAMASLGAIFAEVAVVDHTDPSYGLYVALAIATVPLAAPEVMRETLAQLMQGALATLDKALKAVKDRFDGAPANEIGIVLSAQASLEDNWALLELARTHIGTKHVF